MKKHTEKKTKQKFKEGGEILINSNKGITLIALVITVIVLLILAGISISMLSGDNSILSRAGQAKERTVTSQEEEYAKLTFTEVQMELSQGKTVDSTEFQKMIDGNFGSGNATGTIGGGNYIITITRNGTNYKMGNSGKIETLDELPIDFEPGVLEKSGNTYTINSIEDLVAFSYNVNSGTESYEGKTVTLGRDLDFQDDNSYVDANSKYKKDNNNGYIPDTASETTIKTLVTTDIGFVPIGKGNTNCFAGNFDGKGHYLDNIFIKANSYGGFFGAIIGDGKISNLGIRSGSIFGNAPTGGICGWLYGNIQIDNCYNMADVDTYSPAGGIVGWSNSSFNLKITNCYNAGTILSNTIVGGLIGTGKVQVINCYNNGHISSRYSNAVGFNGEGGGIYVNCCNLSSIDSQQASASGLVSGASVDVTATNCYNGGEIIGKYCAIGILWCANSYEISINMENCYNNGNLIGKNYASSIGAGIIRENGGKATYEIKNCYNSGIINTDQFTTSGEIIGEGEVSSNNYYQKRDSNANSNGATGKDNLSEVITLQKFVDSMNSYVEENNSDSTKTPLKTWKVENGMPVFAE